MRDAAFALTMGAVTFLITVIWGDPFIMAQRLFGIGMPPGYDDDLLPQERPASTEAEAGEPPASIPTMGGLIFILPTVLMTIGLNIVNLLRGGEGGLSVLLPLAIMLVFGAVGALEDWQTLQADPEARLSDSLPLLAQLVAATGAALFLQFVLGIRSVALPGIDERFDLDVPLYTVIAVLVIFACANAFDLTDGPDGLAGITGMTGFIVFGVIALLQGQVYLMLFCFITVGALMAFLWFNMPPALLTLGDTGALAVGAALGTVALMTGQWLLLPVILAIPFAESLSVVLQALYYYAAPSEGRALFKRAPLHNHFRALGWSDPQIVQRFWIIAVLAGVIGVALALL